MIMILNPAAGGGTALDKLKEVEETLRRRWGPFDLVTTESLHQLGSIVRSRFTGGERQFVAAGGDGCVNALLNAIMTSLTAEQQKSVALGAVGLGSSNDFHKPFSPACTIGGVPCTMDFTTTQPRDIGMLTFSQNGENRRSHFLINASAGLTAEANRFFNNPDPVLSLIKRRWTGLAICYAALRTIVGYRNKRVRLTANGEMRPEIELTNLAIFKNPHVSGSLKFPGEACYGSGLLNFHLAQSLHLAGRLKLLHCLATGRSPEGLNMLSWTSAGATLAADRPMAVEYDGEVIMSDHVTISVLPQHVQVCTC